MLASTKLTMNVLKNVHAKRKIDEAFILQINTTKCIVRFVNQQSCIRNARVTIFTQCDRSSGTSGVAHNKFTVGLCGKYVDFLPVRCASYTLYVTRRVIVSPSQWTDLFLHCALNVCNLQLIRHKNTFSWFVGSGVWICHGMRLIHVYLQNVV